LAQAQAHPDNSSNGPEIRTVAEAEAVLGSAREPQPVLSWEHVMWAVQELVGDCVRADSNLVQGHSGGSAAAAAAGGGGSKKRKERTATATATAAAAAAAAAEGHMVPFLLEPSTAQRIQNRLTNVFALPKPLSRRRQYWALSRRPRNRAQPLPAATGEGQQRVKRKAKESEEEEEEKEGQRQRQRQRQRRGYRQPKRVRLLGPAEGEGDDKEEEE
jgi:hypothetical protein